MTARLASLADRVRRIALSIGGPVPVTRTNAAPRPPWYTIRNADDAERAIVQLDGEIGWDVEASTFTKELRAITAPHIDLEINSPGGSVWDGYAIYHALETHPATVTAHVIGVAASAASFIAMAADEVVAYRPSEVMIHDASGWIDVWGYVNPADLARLLLDIGDLKASLDQTSDEVAAIYARKAGPDHGTVADWRARMQATTWYTPDTALAAGLVDRINGEDADDADGDTESPAPGADGATDRIEAYIATAETLARARYSARLTLSEGVK